MLDREKGIILGYLKNLLEYHGSRQEILVEVCDYLEANERLFDEKAKQALSEAREASAPLHDKKMPRQAAIKLCTTVNLLIYDRCHQLHQKDQSALETNLDLLAKHLGLADLEKSMLGLMSRHLNYGHFRHFLDEISKEYLNAVEACAACLAVELEELRHHLRHDSLLLKTGLVQSTPGTGSDLDDIYRLNSTICKALHCREARLESLLCLILGLPLIPTLEWKDFDHLEPVRDKLFTFLQQTLQDRTTGINILFWGSPGTGKTEFCKTLAHALGSDLYAVGEVDDDGNEPNRLERIAALRLTQNLLHGQGHSMALFDEMDDLLKGDVFARLIGAPLSVGSKVFINRLLENNPLPTLWVINDIRSLDESFIRRMSLVVEIKTPPAKMRTRFLGQVLEQNGVAMPIEEVRRMAELNISPAVVAKAACFARKVGGSPQDFNLAAQGIVQAINGGKPLPPTEILETFNPELVNADVDLGELTEQLIRTGKQPISLCLYGPPGTGKSAYVRYLAEQMGMPVILKRASDLLDKYVGESEKNIARAFGEALESEAFLIFDEADSLLGDRRDAIRNWEVSQVNEMLTWMERHPLPFACTTNLMERLDQASLRRFTFKSCFNYLHKQQAAEACRHFFGCDIESHELPVNLTPGDFALVRRKARILGREKDAKALCTMLDNETAIRRTHPGRRIGFNSMGLIARVD